MKNIALALGVFFIPALGCAHSQTISRTPTAPPYQSLEEANRRIQELQAENETLQVQAENAQLHQMERRYDEAHPYPFYRPYPYYGPYPYCGGFGGFDYNHYPIYQEHYHHHDHHHH